jgi:hypothetical protein
VAVIYEYDDKASGYTVFLDYMSKCNFTYFFPKKLNLRFQVLTEASMKIGLSVFGLWLRIICPAFQGCLLVVIILMMEVVSTSETSVNLYATTLRNNPNAAIISLFIHYLQKFSLCLIFHDRISGSG